MKKLIAFLIPAALFIGCTKENKTDKTIPRVVSMPLAVGNYWVYEAFNVDSNNVATSTGQYDTCRIVSNEVINGHIYFNFDNYPEVHNLTTPVKLRDSLGYLVDPTNKVYFSEANFTTLFGNFTSTTPAYNLSQKMDWKDQAITVPADSYNQTATMLGTVNITEPGYQWQTTRYTYTSYAENVGVVKRRYFFFNSPSYIELRLVDYHLE